MMLRQRPWTRWYPISSGNLSSKMPFGMPLRRVPATATSRCGLSELGAKLQLQVKDDGPGLPSNQNSNGSSSKGVGLANTRERLRQLYGTDQRFELAQRFRPGTGRYFGDSL